MHLLVKQEKLMVIVFRNGITWSVFISNMDSVRSEVQIEFLQTIFEGLSFNCTAHAAPPAKDISVRNVFFST